MRRLRIAHVIVTPVLMWDDGDELTPGPEAQPQALPLSALPGVPEQLLAEVARLQESGEGV